MNSFETIGLVLFNTIMNASMFLLGLWVSRRRYEKNNPNRHSENYEHGMPPWLHAHRTLRCEHFVVSPSGQVSHLQRCEFCGYDEKIHGKQAQ